MMTEAQALNALAREDPEAADEAKAALSWLTNGEGLETVSQLKLQEFVWYALPVKWPMTTGELIAVTRALGRLFSMVGMERYAEVCLCPRTETILTAYGDGHDTGIAAYAEAMENSQHRALRHGPAGLGVGDGAGRAVRVRRVRRGGRARDRRG